MIAIGGLVIRASGKFISLIGANCVSLNKKLGWGSEIFMCLTLLYWQSKLSIFSNNLSL